MKILITGHGGFVGRNLRLALEYARPGDELLLCEIDTPREQLARWAARCDFVVHLAGVNRPQDPEEFQKGNAGFTGELLDMLRRGENPCPVLMTSSIQAALDNPYGKSKLEAENLLLAYGKDTGAPIHLYRLPNVFGKFCRPNYNSAVATFCHNIARDLPIRVNDENTLLNLVYIDDVVNEILRALEGRGLGRVEPVYQVTLGRIVQLLRGYRAGRKDLAAPDTGDDFSRKLYAAYLSYLPGEGFSYPLTTHADHRGSFTEFMRTPERGQTSVNISLPGVVKGNHFHHTKNEKFLVVEGKGVVRLRKYDEEQVFVYPVDGQNLTVVDIPPGYTHNIENTGEGRMVTLMWSSECFDPANPDTYPLEV